MLIIYLSLLGVVRDGADEDRRCAISIHLGRSSNLLKKVLHRRFSIHLGPEDSGGTSGLKVRCIYVTSLYRRPEDLHAARSDFVGFSTPRHIPLRSYKI